MAEAVTGLTRIDEIWLSREPLDMRAGPDTALARVINRFGAAKPRTAYVFANKRANRVKVLVCDRFPVVINISTISSGQNIQVVCAGTEGVGNL